MTRRVLLLSINAYEFPYAVYPLGLEYVAAAARQAGHLVEILDVQVDKAPPGPRAAAFRPHVIGISLRNIDDALIQRRETFFRELHDLCDALRHHSHAPLVLGGSGYSIFPHQLLELSGADYGIAGEGERSFVALIEALATGAPPSAVPGLVYRQHGRVVSNPSRVHGTPTPTPPLPPARSERLAQFYLQRSSMLNVQTQRGCALRCCYCTYPLIEGAAHRSRPAEEVVEELAELERLGARYVFLVDSVFNSSPEHVQRLSEGILRRGLKLRWCCFLRPQRLTADLFRTMTAAGLAHVEFGSDSFCDPVLASYGKHLTFEDIRHASALARQAGVEYCHFLICGGPGETEATLATTFAHAQQLEGTTIMARAGMRVYPGTPLFERFRHERGMPDADGLLEPFYYLAPPLTEAGVLATLRGFARRAPNWIVDDPPPTYVQMAERLRAKGVIGPLWSYFAMLQRLGNAFLPGPTPAPP